MRNTLIKWLIENDTKDTYFLTADVGYGVLEPLREKMGKRFINVGIAEQSMISIASGIALSGKKVYTYTMCAFYLRTIEQIKLDLCYQGANVTMIGIGTDYDYEQHGTTHFGLEDGVIVGSLRNIAVYTPADIDELKQTLNSKDFKRNKTPQYLRLSRFKEQNQLNIPAKSTYPKVGGSRAYFLGLADANAS